ncbi:MAG: aldo/keto reductase [Treponemataceae bacterium]
MKYKTFGRTGVLVSELCFGTMTFGAEADEAESARLYAACRDAGINFFDCADSYTNGKSEEILGKLVGASRDEIVLTSKFSNRMGSDVNALGASRRHLRTAVEKSLSRLKTDRIDVYFVHTLDPLPAMEETLRAMDDLVRQGKVLYLGVSNWAAWQIEKALGYSERKNLARFECVQPMYNLVKRQAEVEILPMAAAEGMAVMTYNPMGGGFLSGKYSGATAARSGRLLEKDAYIKRYGDSRSVETAEKFTALAAELGVSAPVLAVSWVKANPAVTCPMIGARNIEQLKGVLPAADFPMSAELYARVTALSYSPPPATDRSEEELDPEYRFRGKTQR